MGTTAGQFVKELASRHRVLVIGGLAVIAHGLNRPTMDADVWVEPLDSPSAWANAVEQICSLFPNLSFHTLPGWRRIAGQEIAIAAAEVGMIRILGLDCPLDIFRQPNQFPPESFEEVFARGSVNADGTHLPDPLDLIITKLDTGRDKDLHDSQHLESVIRKRYRKLLPSASLDEVRYLLGRFVDWDVCRIALDNPSPEVRNFTLQCLREMADEGDPFSQALLEDRQIPYSGA